MPINSDLIYGIDINFEAVGFTSDDYDEGIDWYDSVIKNVREFAYKHDLTPLMSGDLLLEGIKNLVIGVPLYEVREIKDSEIKCIEKAKSLFEEKTKNGLLQELIKVMGQPEDYEPDIHMMIEIR